jgi:heptaprenyl diphosphate synthase
VGLSNVFVILALFALGTGPALLLNAVRVSAGSLLLGMVMSPAFVFSLAGSTGAVVVMALAGRAAGRRLSVIGVSCLGAVSNNCIQALLFSALLAPGALRGLVGTFILMGVGVGVVTGLLAAGVRRKVALESTAGLD